MWGSRTCWDSSRTHVVPRYRRRSDQDPDHPRASESPDGPRSTVSAGQHTDPVPPADGEPPGVVLAEEAGLLPEPEFGCLEPGLRSRQPNTATALRYAERATSCLRPSSRTRSLLAQTTTAGTARPGRRCATGTPRSPVGLSGGPHVVRRQSLSGWARLRIGPGQMRHSGRPRQVGQRSSPGRTRSPSPPSPSRRIRTGQRCRRRTA